MRAKINISQNSPKNTVGFTIVELLIVIVVIGILATITIVSYTGVQNRAFDITVQSDLKNLATYIELYKIDNAKYPSSSSNLGTLNYRSSNKNAYAVDGTTQINMTYCYDSTSAATTYAVLAMSKSGNKFVVGDTKSLGTHTGTWGNGSTANCASVAAALTQSTNGYLSTDTTTGPWRSWVGN